MRVAEVGLSRLAGGSRGMVGSMSDRLAVVVIALFTFAIYLPVVVIPYATADDLAQLAAGHGFFEDLWRDYFGNGRPLGAVLVVPAFSLTSDIAGLRLVRLVSVAAIVVLGALLYRALARTGMDRWVSTAAAMSVVSLPSFQVYAAQTVSFIAPCAAILAGLASNLTTSAIDAGPRARVGRLAAGSALLLCAILTYQATAMFFWVFAGIALLRPDAPVRRARRVLTFHLVAGVPSAVISFITFRILIHYYGEAGTRASFAHSVMGKLGWFFDQPLRNALCLFALTPSPLLAWCVAIAIVVGIALLYDGDRSESLRFLLLAMILVPLTVLPNLATADSTASYRSIGALASLLAIYVWFALWGVSRHVVQPEPMAIRQVPITRLTVLGVAPLLGFLCLSVVAYPLWKFPDLAPVANWKSDRWLAALAVLVAVAVWIAATGRKLQPRAGRRIASIVPSAVAVLAAAAVPATAGLLAARNVTTLFARPKSAELNMLRTALRGVKRAPVQRVAVIRPDWKDAAAPLVAFDEFGYPSLSPPWGPLPAVFLILGAERRRGKTLIVDNLPPETSQPPRNELVVDMRNLKKLHERWTFWTLRAWP